MNAFRLRTTLTIAAVVIGLSLAVSPRFVAIANEPLDEASSTQTANSNIVVPDSNGTELVGGPNSEPGSETEGSNPKQEAETMPEPEPEPVPEPAPEPSPNAPSETFRGISAVVHTSQDNVCLVAAQDVKGHTSLLLPTCANVSSLEIVLPQPYNTPVQLSVSPQGPFATGPFNISSCTRNAQGDYVMYARFTDTQAPFSVLVAQSVGVDALFLTSDDPDKHGRAYVESSADHSAGATGSYAMVSQAGSRSSSGALSLIRGRGNSSWLNQKKPYQIKLEKKASLIDGTSQNSAKTWLLVPSQYDETMMRNYIAYKTAQALGLSESPDCMFVDLYYDGEYRGLYLLSEKVEFATGRIPAQETQNYSNYGTSLDNNATAQAKNSYGYTYQYVTGAVSPLAPQDSSYLLELDKSTYSSERCWFETSAGPIVVKSPDNLNADQMKFISQHVQQAINEASKPQGNMAAYFDVDSLARVFLVNEFAKSPDWLRYSSTYFYYNEADDLLHWGPVWDFDLAFGVHAYEGSGEYIDVNGWASQTSMFFENNAQFLASMRTILTRDALPVFRCWAGTTAGTLPSVRGLANQLAGTVALDRKIWDAANASSVAVFLGSFDTAVTYTQRWIAERTAWLETNAKSFPYQGKAGTGLVRLAGQNALETMNAIVDHCVFAREGTVVLTTVDGYWDALTAAGLAGFAQAPVLMTNGEELSAQTATQLKKLKPSTIVVCGGPAAVSNRVARAAQLAAEGKSYKSLPNSATPASSGVTVKRCAGNTATGTAVDIFTQTPNITGGTWSRTAFVCTNAGYWDALAAAPISYACGMPIFLSEGATSFSEATINALRTRFNAVYVVGGTAAISKAAVQQLQAAGIVIAGRIWGETAIGTSQELARFGLAKGMHAHNMGIATINGYWDSLSGAALCGRDNSVLVLAADPRSTSITGFVAEHRNSIKRLYLFGGPAALSKEVETAVRKAAL